MRRILFVSCNYASDYGLMVWGTYIRMRMLLEAAYRAADALDVLLFVAPDFIATADPLRVAESLRQAWRIDATVHLAPRSTAAHGGWASTVRGLFDIRFQRDYGDAGGAQQSAAVVGVLREDTDLIVAHRLDAAMPAIDGAKGRVPIVMNLDDIEHVTRRRRVERLSMSVATLIGRVELPAIERAEMAALGAARCVVVCSQEEKNYLIARGIRTRIDVVHNAVEFPEDRERQVGNGNTVMFIGSYGYQPNIEAAEELINEVFPRILAHRPDARLLIAGARSERLPSYRLNKPGVEILGFVADVSEIYSRAAVACCPIRAGGGTRIKIIEACAWKIPTVSTTLGAEGLNLEENQEILIAESSAALADACIALLTNPIRAEAIGAAAYRKAKATYDRAAVIEQIVSSYRATASSPLQ